MFKLGWLVPENEESIDSFLKYGEKLSHVSPTWLWFDSNASLHVSVSEEEIYNFLALSKERGLKVVPLVVNEKFDADVAGAILGEKNSRRKAAEELARFAEKYQVKGINLDFEGTFGLWRDHYTEFVRGVAKLLHDIGMEVSVDVVCQTNPPKPIDALKESESEDSAKWILSWADSYDYKGLGEVVDQFILMGYDYHARGLEPGPVGPLWWLRKVLDYTLNIVPAEKVVLGLPFYGRGWTSKEPMKPEEWTPREVASELPIRSASEAGFEPGDAYNYAQIEKMLDKFVRQGRDPLEASPWGIWELEDGRIRVVYYDDVESLKEKLLLTKEYNLLGTAFWRLGHEDFRIWEVLDI
ncbi:MAG TPA: glycosyl hydrolase family 18 [Clostridia bacterium]|nr:glycosyl hydrolase family 18 [Clostridia bacterium]